MELRGAVHSRLSWSFTRVLLSVLVCLIVSLRVSLVVSLGVSLTVSLRVSTVVSLKKTLNLGPLHPCLEEFAEALKAARAPLQKATS